MPNGHRLSKAKGLGESHGAGLWPSVRVIPSKGMGRAWTGQGIGRASSWAGHGVGRVPGYGQGMGRAYEQGIWLYTRYPIVARRAWPTGASKGILHTRHMGRAYGQSIWAGNMGTRAYEQDIWAEHMGSAYGQGILAGQGGQRGVGNGMAESGVHLTILLRGVREADGVRSRGRAWG